MPKHMRVAMAQMAGFTSNGVEGENMTAEQIQEKLQALGLYKGRIDGDLGPKSRTAIGKALAMIPVNEKPVVPVDSFSLKQTSRAINYMVVHCSATRPKQSNIGRDEIDQMHKARGWSEIGYHYVIKRDGTLEIGRDIDKIGAHVGGYNTGSLGICLVGGINDDSLKPENNYTEKQWATLKRLLKTLSEYYPKAKVRGHRDYPKVAKACPCFDAIPWAKANGFNGG